jgi:chromosome segregation ATPase
MSRRDDIRKLITEHHRRLQKLKEKEARFGISTSPEVLTEIEDIEAEIKRLQGELESLEDDGGEDLVADDHQPPAPKSRTAPPPSGPWPPA